LRFLPKYDIRIIKDKLTIFGSETNIEVTSNTLASSIIGITLFLIYILTSHWSLNNVIGILLSIYGVVQIRVPKLSNILLLLWLLFIYDIVMVF
jgi:hypothetical protein